MPQASPSFSRLLWLFRAPSKWSPPFWMLPNVLGICLSFPFWLVLLEFKSPLVRCLQALSSPVYAMHCSQQPPWSLKYRSGGFPGGAVVENLPANAGDTGSSPGLGRSHMPWSNWAREPQLLSLRIWSLCSATREATTVRGPRTAMKSGPRLPQLEKALTETKTQHSQK